MSVSQALYSVEKYHIGVLIFQKNFSLMVDENVLILSSDNTDVFGTRLVLTVIFKQMFHILLFKGNSVETRGS